MSKTNQRPGVLEVTLFQACVWFLLGYALAVCTGCGWEYEYDLRQHAPEGCLRDVDTDCNVLYYTKVIDGEVHLCIGVGDTPSDQDECNLLEGTSG